MTATKIIRPHSFSFCPKFVHVWREPEGPIQEISQIQNHDQEIIKCNTPASSYLICKKQADCLKIGVFLSFFFFPNSSSFFLFLFFPPFLILLFNQDAFIWCPKYLKPWPCIYTTEPDISLVILIFQSLPACRGRQTNITK